MRKKRTPEQVSRARSKAAKTRWAALNAEQRSEALKAVAAKVSPAKRRRNGKAAALKRWAAKSAPDRPALN